MRMKQSFDSSHESISAARTFVTSIVSDAHVEVRESVAVMVSELATNALVQRRPASGRNRRTHRLTPER